MATLGTLGAYLSPVIVRSTTRRWHHGEGHRLFDADGRSYLDFASGAATTALGHRHPAVTAAIHEQVDRLLHVPNGLGFCDPVDALAADLVATLPQPLDSVFFQSSGSEAVEGALKLARRASGRKGIVAFSGGFHGRTMGALSATTSNAKFRTGHEPLVPQISISAFPATYREFGGDETAATTHALKAFDTLLAKEMAPETVAAIIIEPVQGEGGYVPAPLPFLQALRERCDRYGILFIADEIQSGLGRTGRMWGFEHAGIVPDIICLAKGIANGLPLGALVADRGLMERWGAGAHAATFGGNPVACAAGVAVLRTIRDEGLVANAAARGDELRAALELAATDDPGIGDVRGRGLMIGVEFVTDRRTRRPAGDRAWRIMERCLDLGLLVLTCGIEHHVIRWIAPLDVTRAEIYEAMGIFRRALEDVPA